MELTNIVVMNFNAMRQRLCHSKTIADKLIHVDVEAANKLSDDAGTHTHNGLDVACVITSVTQSL